jgi:subtilase family serine protease
LAAQAVSDRTLFLSLNPADKSSKTMRFLAFTPLLISLLMINGQTRAFGAGLASLSGHVPSAKLIRHSRDLGRKPARSRMNLAISLKTKDSNSLSAWVKRLYDPTDSQFHHFLTPEKFADTFAISQTEIEQVKNYLTAKGLNIVETHANRLIIDVEGPTSAVENAFQIEMHDYVAEDGRIVQAPTTDPVLSSEIAAKLNGISGLNSFRHLRSHARTNPKLLGPKITPESYMTPAKIKTAYSLSSLSQTGSGQSIALVELDAFTPSDISSYTSHFGITAPAITIKPVDGGVSSPGSGADEVTLDIELTMAIAPGVSNVYVYEAPDTDILDIYSHIASDNVANIVSTSWGDAENDEDSTNFNYLAENTFFLEMATQGQTVIAAAGDNGAYDDSVNNINSLQVDDPSSQPYVTGVGGTTLELNTDNSFLFERAWSDSTASPAEGGGGGISRHFFIPSWQQGLATSSNLGSNTYRMVPDVSLDADPTTGYAIYYNGAWSVYGGTSCATPLWAAFTALVNQQRLANGLSVMGFLNPSLYQAGTGVSSAIAFHDINDASTNLYYPAVIGYDLATGWGSINGTGLFNILTTQTVVPGPSPTASVFAPPSIPTGLSAQVIQ